MLMRELLLLAKVQGFVGFFSISEYTCQKLEINRSSLTIILYRLFSDAIWKVSSSFKLVSESIGSKLTKLARKFKTLEEKVMF